VPLIELVKGMGLGADIIAPGDTPPPHDFHCPLMSLPLAFGTTIDTVPHFDRYIYAPDGHVKKWGAFMGQMTGPKIGIVARGSRSHANDKNRSFELKALVAQLPQHASYVVLQKDLSDDERAFVDSCDNIIAPGEALESFSDTAAICTHLDQVISVDTGVAHLAGALGTPTTLLLAYRPDWRWGADGETTGWYPNTRLIRQTRSRGWRDAFSIWHMDCL
jgi:ADP-heptose:LPS heptosyltransferase